MTDCSISVGFRMWINVGTLTIGRGRAQLLAAIEQEGSISAAARACKISYRAAWNWLDKLNADPAGPMVQATAGGQGGGRATLTNRGKEILTTYERAYEQMAATAQKM